MSHDLRQALGYRHIPAKDPKEQELRNAVFQARAEWVGAGAELAGAAYAKRLAAEARLSDYLWGRACQAVAEDRRKHPKAKRNAAVGSQMSSGGSAARDPVPHIEGLTAEDPRGVNPKPPRA